jgi:hypothetical protein
MWGAILPFFLFISCGFSQCQNGTSYGADCTCSHDFIAFLDSQNIVSTGVVCALGIWSYPGTLNLDSVYWDIKSDTVQIEFDLSTTPNTKIHMDLNPGKAPSGFIKVNRLWSPFGTYTFNLLSADVGSYTIPLVQYFNRIDGKPAASAPVFPPYPYSICRVPSGDPTLNLDDASFVMNIVIKNHPTFDCEKGRGNRDWVIIFMVIVSIHALFFLLFLFNNLQKRRFETKSMGYRLVPLYLMFPILV